MKLPEELLQAWHAAALSPDLWRAANGEDVDPSRLTSAYLEILARAPRPEDTFKALIAEGSFELAGELPREQDPSGELDQALWAARTASIAEFDNAMAELRERSARVHRSDLLGHATEEAIERWRGRDRGTARAYLEEVELAVKEEEEAHSKRLRDRLQRFRVEVTATDPQTWSEAVRRAIESKQYDLAEQLLDRGPTGDEEAVSTVLPKRPEAWVYRSYDTREILRWLLTGDGARKEFYAKWRPQEEDRAAWDLLQALAVVIESRGEDRGDVAAFADALERFLGDVPRRPRVMEEVHGGFRTRLRGLADPAAPTLVDASAEADCWLYLEAKEGDLSTDIAAEFDQREGPVILFSLNADVARAPAYLVLDASELFRTLPDVANRRLNVLRSLVPQLPERRRLASTIPSPTATACFGREEELRRACHSGGEKVQLIFGCPGVGTSTFLRKVESELISDGWEIWNLERFLFEGVDGLAEAGAEPTPEALAEWLAARDRAGLALTADGMPEHVACRLPELVSWAKRLHDALRVVVTGGLEARERVAPHLPAEYCWQLPSLSFHDVRTLVMRMLDLRGIEVRDSAVLDRIAYYSAGRPALLHVLVSALTVDRKQRGLPTEAPVTRDHVEAAVKGHRFRLAARRWLLDPVERDPQLQTVYAGVLYGLYVDGSLMDRVPRSSGAEILGLLTGERFELPESVFLNGLKRLADLEILSPVQRLEDAVALAPGAVASLCLALSGEPDAYIKD